MLRSDLIREGLRREPLLADLIVLPTVDSTNEEALRRAANGAPEGTVVLAETQVAGHGSRGRSWHSPPGVGLYVSVVLRPRGPWAVQARWTLVAATAACEVCREHVDCDVIIKWPNDLFVGDLKVGGVLAESRDAPSAEPSLVVGVGLNVNHLARDFPPSLRAQAISLRMATGFAMMEREPLAIAFLRRLGEFVRVLGSDDGWPEIAARWGRLTPGHDGARVRVVKPGPDGEGDAFEAVTRGVDVAGALRVERADGSIALLHSRDALRPLKG
jgi:BirA family biotin operon repressor/biotin-[acetyl-CoA-carboxylase] ligase